MVDVRVDMDLKGPFFGANVTDEVRESILSEVLDKVEQRAMRTPRSPKAGRKNNTLSSKRHEQAAAMSLSIDSTLNRPRVTGGAWVKFNIGMIRKLAPNVVRAAGRRLAQRLGGQ